MDVKQELFEIYAFYVALLIAKTLIMSFLTARRRLTKNVSELLIDKNISKHGFFCYFDYLKPNFAIILLEIKSCGNTVLNCLKVIVQFAL